MALNLDLLEVSLRVDYPPKGDYRWDLLKQVYFEASPYRVSGNAYDDHWVVNCDAALQLDGVTNDLVLSVERYEDPVGIMPACERDRWMQWLVHNETRRASLSIFRALPDTGEIWQVMTTTSRPRRWLPKHCTQEQAASGDRERTLAMIRTRLTSAVASLDSLEVPRLLQPNLDLLRQLVLGIADALVEIFAGLDLFPALMDLQNTCVLALDICEALAHPCDEIEAEDYAATLRDQLLGMGEDLHYYF